MADGVRGGFDDDGSSVDDRSVDGVDDRSCVDGLDYNGGSVHYRSVNGVYDRRSMNDRSVDSVDNRSAMVYNLRRFGDSSLGCDYGISVGVYYWSCMDCGYYGGGMGENDAGRSRCAGQNSGESNL